MRRSQVKQLMTKVHEDLFKDLSYVVGETWSDYLREEVRKVAKAALAKHLPEKVYKNMTAAVSLHEGEIVVRYYDHKGCVS